MKKYVVLFSTLVGLIMVLNISCDYTAVSMLSQTGKAKPSVSPLSLQGGHTFRIEIEGDAYLDPDVWKDVELTSEGEFTIEFSVEVKSIEKEGSRKYVEKIGIDDPDGYISFKSFDKIVISIDADDIPYGCYTMGPMKVRIWENDDWQRNNKYDTGDEMLIDSVIFYCVKIKNGEIYDDLTLSGKGDSYITIDVRCVLKQIDIDVWDSYGRVDDQYVEICEGGVGWIEGYMDGASYPPYKLTWEFSGISGDLLKKLGWTDGSTVVTKNTNTDYDTFYLDLSVPDNDEVDSYPSNIEARFIVEDKFGQEFTLSYPHDFVWIVIKDNDRRESVAVNNNTSDKILLRNINQHPSLHRVSISHSLFHLSKWFDKITGSKSTIHPSNYNIFKKLSRTLLRIH